jgi:hypothetical protein
MNKIKTGKRQQGISTAEIFTYILIAMMIPVVLFGFYHNNRLDKTIAEALAVGEEKKILIGEYFQAQGKCPTEAETGLDRFMPVGELINLVWQPGAMGESNSDKLRTGALKGVLDLSDFGERFEELESGYLLIARAQEDETIVWDCVADSVTSDSLPGRYLPESCKKASDSED